MALADKLLEAYTEEARRKRSKKKRSHYSQFLSAFNKALGEDKGERRGKLLRALAADDADAGREAFMGLWNSLGNKIFGLYRQGKK